MIVDLRKDNGDKVKEVKSWFSFETPIQKYLAFVLEYTEDTATPENVGLYTLRIIKAEDEKAQFGYWQDMKISGIYRYQEIE